VQKTLGIQTLPLSTEHSKRLWLARDYDALVAEQSKISGEDLERTSQRLGELNLSFYQDGNCYRYNDQLGLVKAD